MAQNYLFSEELIRRYDTAGPRYTSYPTALQFDESFGEADYRACAEQTNLDSRITHSPKPLSLYFHIPFCNTVCFYCGCSKVVTKDRSKAAPYLERVHKEIQLQSELFDSNRPVNQLHWGGGTPTFISHDEMRQLMNVTRQYFNLKNDDSGEYSIEIDPREVSSESLTLLREIGFNRLSLGVQDFDETVQKAVNRIQPEEQTLAVMDAARQLNYKSLSVDLIYGLPFQTLERFHNTVDKVIQADPDRISIFNYAHLPTMFKPQRRINEADLPQASEKLLILKHTMKQLVDAGYVYIGMDHFAKPDDELAIAQRNGSLYRNFQGYSTHSDCDLIAMGITAISKVGPSYSQNVKTLEQYYEIIDKGHLPVYRGLQLNQDDEIRRTVIEQLICHFNLNINKIETSFDINFNHYFDDELRRLASMKKDGLLEFDDVGIQVLPVGRLLIRNICMVFDQYLGEAKTNRYSKVI